MPASPELALDLARDTLAIYTEAELLVLQKVARRLARGITGPGWAEDKLRDVRALNADLAAIIAAMQAASDVAVLEAIEKGYERGQAAAVADLSLPALPAPAQRVAALARATQGRLSPVGLRVTRWAGDVYSRTVTETTAQVLAGSLTRREASALTLSRLAQRGVTGFVDRAGRGWDMATYAEMAVRTSTAQAAIQGHADQLQARGKDLVIVSNAPEECKICRPAESEVLSLSGANVGLIVKARYGIVRRSLAEAVAAGLLHSNCRHRLGLFIDGVTDADTHTADPEGDELRQRQRGYERRIRELKRRIAVEEALDPAKARATRALLRAKQADFRTWREQHGRKELAYRTSIKTR